MDSKTLRHKIGAGAGLDGRTTAALTEAFARVLAESAESMASVAVPSFGTFTPKKYEEEIGTDLSTGKKMLYPPQIVLEFQPAASLRKKITESHE